MAHETVEYSFSYKGEVRRHLKTAEHLIAVSGAGDLLVADRDPGIALTRVGKRLGKDAKRILTKAIPQKAFRSGVQILATEDADDDRAVLKREGGLRFAGHTLVDPKAGEPVIYSETLYVQFEDDVSEGTVREVLMMAGPDPVVQRLPYAPFAYAVSPSETLGRRIFDLSLAILERSGVAYCHPEIMRERKNKVVHPRQWHLAARTISGALVDQHAAVEAAWALTTGVGVNIAVIDDGIDIRHPDLKANIIAPFDAGSGGDDPRPRYKDECHGTACAGVACAAGIGASGVAPNARLMPIRLYTDLGSLEEADAFYWAARHGADVISCSWGPEDGEPSDPDDPLHTTDQPLSASSATAIKAAATTGRGGLGCAIFFAAGNGNESCDLDGYARCPDVMAIAAINSKGKRSNYSDYGDAVFCAFPSDDYPLKAHGIWTTDRRGLRQGYNTTGHADEGDADGHYTATFGGTSSACPGAAGVAALMIAKNPRLSLKDLRDAMAGTCDQVGGVTYTKKRSKEFGHGRLNAFAAVKAV